MVSEVCFGAWLQEMSTLRRVPMAMVRLIVIGEWLLVIGYRLMVIGNWLLVTGYWVLVTSNQ